MRQTFGSKPIKKALPPFFLSALACAIAVALPLTLNPRQTRVTSPNLLPGQSSTILPAGGSLLLGGETAGFRLPRRSGTRERGQAGNCRRSLDMRGHGTPRRCCRTARF